jgi:hypothetical protein
MPSNLRDAAPAIPNGSVKKHFSKKSAEKGESCLGIYCIRKQCLLYRRLLSDKARVE